MCDLVSVSVASDAPKETPAEEDAVKTEVKEETTEKEAASVSSLRSLHRLKPPPPVVKLPKNIQICPNFISNILVDTSKLIRTLQSALQHKILSLKKICRSNNFVGRIFVIGQKIE